MEIVRGGEQRAERQVEQVSDVGAVGGAIAGDQMGGYPRWRSP
jgi:hypothetical protein